MGYSETFGGALLFPSQLSYLLITTDVDVTLQWPVEQQVGGDEIVSDFLDVDATDVSLNIDMPSASATGTGNKVTFNNVGSNTFTVRDSTGGTIQSVAPGEAWVIVLRDNTSAAGLWRTFQLGASVSVASASALAGAGIKSISTTLNQKIDSDVEGTTPITVVDGDRAKCLIYTAGAGIADLPNAATVGNDWFFMLRNSGSGTLVVTPAAGDIDGASTINLDPGDSAFIFTDGTDWFTVGLSSGSTIAFDFVSIAIPGSGDFTLSGANLDRISYRFTGALTGNRKVIVPNTTQQYWVDNQTSGAFTLEIATAAQISPPSIGQGDTIIFYSDATDVINAVNTAAVSFPISIAQGGTGATDAATALANLAGASETIDLTAGAGMTGGGDLTLNRTFNVIAGTGITVNADDVQLEVASDLNTDHGAVDIIAGAGMTGGGLITASRTLNVIAGTGITVNADDVALNTGNSRNVDHAGVTLTAGVGLSGGGTIEANRTFTVDLDELVDMGTTQMLGSDSFIVLDGANSRKISIDDIRMPISVADSGAHTILATEMNSIKEYTGSGGHNWALNTGVGLSGQIFVIANDGSGTVSITGTATVESASGNLGIEANGVGVLVSFATDRYKLTGDLI